MTDEAISQTREVSSVEAEVTLREEQYHMHHRVDNRLVLPEDGYEWRKYGTKFIKSIQKYRSYFKCQKSDCRAKKRAEWSDSDDSAATIRVVYDGVHTHASPTTPPSTSGSANPYNLLTQVFGDHQTSSPKHDIPEN